MPIEHKQKNLFSSDVVLADQDYFADEQGNLTTDSTKAAHWIARKGSPISKADQEKHGIPLQKKGGKVAQADEKATIPASANKKENPSENKGVK